MNTNEIIAAFEKAGQGQVFRFWEELSPGEREGLLLQAQEIDLEEIAKLVRLHLDGEAAGPDLAGLEPAPYFPLPEEGGNQHAWDHARNLGEEALREGRVAAFTVAGGQGTRLGYDAPKGTFRVTPVEQKPLFQVLAEKILASEQRYGRPVPWYIMTSHVNHSGTEAFFREHQFFGLESSRVHFIRQGRMPAVGFDGRILLETRSSIAMSPEGHGGSLRALLRSGALDRMERDGIEVVSYFQVDNPLVRCLDPEFIGFHLQSRSEMSCKMVAKAYPEEKVGHFCLQNGKLVVIEYSDLPESLARERDEDGRLRFRAGSIAIHLFHPAFIRRVASGEGSGTLPFHRADKKVPSIDSDGNPVKPDGPNGVKFELFVFDALPFAQNPLVIEARRADEFSPVKNAEGVDSPRTCREDQMRLFARWLKAAGVDVPVDATGLPAYALEISPRFASDQEAFVQAWGALSPKPEVGPGFYLE